MPDWDTRAVLWLSAALAVTLLGIVLSTLRWRQVLAALGLRARAAHALLPLPGRPVRGQLPALDHRRRRAAGQPALGGQRATGPDTFASVVLERLTGWLVLPLLTLAAMAVNPGLSQLGRPAPSPSRSPAGPSSSWSACWSPPPAPGSAGGWPAAPDGSASSAPSTSAWAASGATRGRRRACWRSGFAYQLAVVLAAFLAARALGVDVGPDRHPRLHARRGHRPGAAHLASAASACGRAPSCSSCGPLGVAAGQAVALGLLVYGLNLAVSLLGAPAFAVGAPRTAG